MEVVKWKNSLAVRLPLSVIEALHLKPGDQVDIKVTKSSDVTSEMTREEATEALHRLQRPFPPGFRFNREEANER